MTIDTLTIDQLKAQWLADPCWDIEETEGFEDVRDELLTFRHDQEARWLAERQATERQLAHDWGILGHVCSSQQDFGYMMRHLLAKIERLEKRISQIENA